MLAAAPVLLASLDIKGIPALVLAAIGVLSALAAAVAVIRATYAKAQIEALRGDRDDLSVRVQFLESENNRLQATLQTEIHRREALERTVTGKEELTRLLRILQDHVLTAKAIERIVKSVESKVDALRGPR